MTTAAEFLHAAAEGLRVDVEYIARGKLAKDLSEADRIRMEAKRIAADLVDQVALERLAAVQQECTGLVAAVAHSNFARGRAVGLGDAGRILEVRIHVTRWWWQVPPLRSALDAVTRLAAQHRDAGQGDR